MSRKHGGQGAVRDAAAELAADLDQARERAEARQLSLLAPTRFTGKRAAEQRGKIAEDARRARVAGRPAGAQNMDTRKLKDFLRAHGYDPVIARWRWLLHTPETLASELNCSKLEAAGFLDRIHADIQKLFYAPAVAVDDQGKAVPSFSLTIGGNNVAVQLNAGGGAALEVPPWMTDAEVAARLGNSEQNQPVIEADAEKSHADKSQTGEKA